MHNFVDLHNIKLIIWDLDNTLWRGILTEGGIQDNFFNYKFVQKLTDYGIINSICSKNDIEPVEKELQRIGLDELFVFKSINYEPKGNRVIQIIKKMNLRAENVLFLDDDKKNLEEVKSVLPEISVSTPEIIPVLAKQLGNSFKLDSEHKRLQQYKVLEEKSADSENFCDHEKFLQSCNIRIYIGHDCKSQSERIYELMLRTNQLNYTKYRPTKDEFELLLSDSSLETAYISCVDKYGDYGIIGFYAYKKENNELLHFLFSCRILGMGIEDYVYYNLGRPKLNFVGYIVNDLTSACPTWIKVSDISLSFIENIDNKEKKSDDKIAILFKGPCDLYLVEKFFPKKLHIITEFTYINDDNWSVESFNHTTEILSSKNYTESQKEEMMNSLPFIDGSYYQTQIFDKKWDVVILSMLCDYSLGTYKKKDGEESFVYGQFTRNILDETKWGQLSSAHFPKFDKEILKSLKQNYIYNGLISKENMIKNLSEIRYSLDPNTILILLGGAEFNFIETGNDVRKDRYIIHQEYNKEVKRFCENIKNCEFLDVNQFIKGSSSFIDTISHYTNDVYFNIAQQIVAIINKYSKEHRLTNINKISLLRLKLFRIARDIYGKIVPTNLRLLIHKIVKK